LLSTEFGQPISGMSHEQCAYVAKDDVGWRGLGCFVNASTLVYEEGGDDFYEVTRLGTRLFRLKINLLREVDLIVKR
jgi:hypothetical protein